MKQPDRFEMMVDTVLTCDFMVGKSEAMALLRRQHAAYVRMVKRSAATVGDVGLSRAMTDDLLAAMARYKKGTR